MKNVESLGVIIVTKILNGLHIRKHRIVEFHYNFMEAQYNKLQIEACVHGWIVTQKGQDTIIFIRWEQLINYIKTQLASE